MKPIIQLLSPSPSSPAKRLAWLDWLNAVGASAFKSGLITLVLDAAQGINTRNLSPWQAFAVGFVVLFGATLQRLYNTGHAPDDPTPPAPDGPAPDPNVSITCTAKKAA